MTDSNPPASRPGTRRGPRAAAYQLSRRQFLGGLGGMAAAGSLAAGLSACGSGSSSTTAATAGKSWARPPVTFTFLDTQEPTHLDPALETEFDEFTVTRNIYDPLVWPDEATSTLKPWLAASWSANADATSHTFTIRPNVKFHDGSALDADAVVLSLNRYRAIGAAGEGYLLDGITKVTATDAMTVVIETSAPQPWLPAHLTKFGILSAQAIRAHKTASDPWAQKYFAANAVGTGAYKLSSWVHGVSITLTKNESWWNGPWQPGSIDTVIIKPESDASTRSQLIASRSADFATEWTVQDAVQVGRQPGFTLLQEKTYDTDPVIFFDAQRPPFNNKLVRQAMQYAFDYAGMREFFSGYAVPTTGVFPPFYPYAAPGLPEFSQDLPKARSLLHSAGVDPSSLSVKIATPVGYADLIAGATIFQSSLQQLGVSASVQQLPYGQIIAAYQQSPSPYMVTDIYNSPFTFDPTQFMAEFLPSNSTNEFSRYSDPVVTGLVGKAGSTTDQAEVRQALDQAQRLLRDDAPCIFGATPETLVVVPDYLEGFVMQKTDYRFPCLFYLLRVRQH
jgi:peptide/nickel transport system substrate-binding protein